MTDEEFLQSIMEVRREHFQEMGEAEREAMGVDLDGWDGGEFLKGQNGQGKLEKKGEGGS